MASHGWTAGAGTLRRSACALILLFSTAALAQGNGSAGASGPDRSNAWAIDRWSPHIAEASERFAVPADWIRRVMDAESGGRTMLNGRPVTSRAGAMGLMQLMPATWTEMRAKHGLGPDPHDPRDNILAGTAYLRAMHDRFGYPGLFAAYNAGPTRYAEHLARGRPLPAETVAYVAAVGSASRRDSASLRNEPAKAGIFVSLLNSPSPETGASPAVSDALFVRLSTASAAIE
jgi:soluble lytic murein transglycosylase-like protein